MNSMTGYGAAKGASGNTGISVEIKSVNSRYFDCGVKIPRVFAVLEEPIKAAVGRHISRGKIEVFVSADTSQSGSFEIKINAALAKAYISALREFASEYGLADDISVMGVTRFPDVLSAEKSDADPEALGEDLLAVLEEALCKFDAMRAEEGSRLRLDITARIDEVERLVCRAEEVSPRSVEEYRNKLETKMRELLQKPEIDEQRLLLEAAIFADRIAINEELVRLKSHIAQLREMLGSAEPVGRKIDFLLQEFNREANTVGSKGNDTEMAKITVDLKSEIEKIREQAQNIE